MRFPQFLRFLPPVLSLALGLHGQAKPTDAMKVYTDAETGVSLRYPAVLKNGQGGFEDPLDQARESDAKPPVPRLSLRWSSYSQSPGDSDHVTTWSLFTNTFEYALLPEKTARKCAARFALPYDEYSNPATVMLNGVRFRHVSYSPEPGLGHSGRYELYTTFHRGRCLGFSVGYDSYAGADEPTPAEAREVPGGPIETLKSLRLR